MQVYFNKSNFLLSMEQYLLVKRLKFVFQNHHGTAKLTGWCNIMHTTSMLKTRQHGNIERYCIHCLFASKVSFQSIDF